MRAANLCSSCYRVQFGQWHESCVVPATEEKLIGSDFTREKGKVTHDKRGQFSERRLVICGRLLAAFKGPKVLSVPQEYKKMGKMTT